MTATGPFRRRSRRSHRGPRGRPGGGRPSRSISGCRPSSPCPMSRRRRCRRPGFRGVQPADRQPDKRPGEFDHDAGIGRQKALADDAADRSLAANQDGLDVAAVLVGNQVGDQARTAGKMHDLDVVAGVVEQIVRISVAFGKIRRQQPEVSVVQAPQQIVEWPLPGRPVVPRSHPKNSSVAVFATSQNQRDRRLCPLVNRQRNSGVMVSVPECRGVPVGRSQRGHSLPGLRPGQHGQTNATS